MDVDSPVNTLSPKKEFAIDHAIPIHTPLMLAIKND
jgi:hypothetical protein